MKKSLWFILSAVLAVLLFFTGCPTDGGDDGPGTIGSEDTTGGGGGGGSSSGGGDGGTFTVTEDYSLAALQSIVTQNTTIIFDKAVTIDVVAGGPTILDLGSKTVTVNAEVIFDTTAVTINATKATKVTFTAGTGKFKLAVANSVYLGTAVAGSIVDGSGTTIASVPAGTAEDVANLQNAAKLAVPTYTIGVPALTANATIYVTDTLTIPQSATAPATGTIIALGDVGITGTGSVAVPDANYDFSSVKELKIANTVAAVTGITEITAETITLSGNVSFANVTSLTVSDKSLNGPGTLTLAASVTDVDIGGGNGSVVFETGTPALDTANFGNTGSVTFKAAASITAATASFAGPVNVEDTLTLGDETTFNKDVVLTNSGGALAFPSTGGTVTLKSGVAISVAGTPNTTILKADADTVLTSGSTSGATLTAGTAKLTLDTDSLTLTSGALTVAKTLTVAVADDFAITGTATATVGSGDNKVTLTKAAITGDTATGAVLDGAAGTITLVDNDKITLTGGGSIVVAGGGGVALEHSAFGSGTYTAVGDVVITAVNSGGDTIVTTTTLNDGLIIGTGDTPLKLLGQGSTAATYTLKKVTAGLVFTNGAITVGNGNTSDASSLEASADANIVLGTGAINLGNNAKLVLEDGATIGVFSDASTEPADGSGSGGASGSIGGATITGSSSSDHKLTNTSGTLSGDADATLTGASTGSTINVGATFVVGTVGS
jgi:hypothetical protein